MIVEADELAGELKRLIDASRHEEALHGAASFIAESNGQRISELRRDPLAASLALFVPALDAVVRDIGVALADSMGHELRTGPGGNLILHVLTEIYAVGGHTRVLADVICALPDYQHCVLLTDLYGRIASKEISVPDLREFLGGQGVDRVVLGSGTLQDKVRQLIGILLQTNPTTCFLYPHHTDVIAAAAVSDRTCLRSVLVHHCDHLPSLGPTREDYVHADVTMGCHSECSKMMGDGAQYLGLTAQDQGARVPQQGKNALDAACSGPPAKFWPDPPGLRYVDIVQEVMRSAGGKFYHIGGVPLDALADIRRCLQGSGIDPSRFVDVGRVDSVWQTFKALGVDFYIDSYPMGGAKTIVEALGAALPVIMPVIAGRSPLVVPGLSTQSAISWHGVEEIGQAVNKVRDHWSILSARARLDYEANYSQARFREKLLLLLG